MFSKPPPPPPPGPKPGFHASNFKPTNELAYELRDDDATRNQLFAGAEQPAQPGGERTIDELVGEAVDKHQDTTKTAQRALRILEQTKQVHTETLAEVQAQGQQMYRLNDKLNQVNQDLTYSEKLLRYMRRCCCCILCDSCTGADPEGQREKQWAKRVDAGKTSKYDTMGNVIGNGRGGAGPSSSKSGGGAAMKPGTYRDPDIRLTEQHKDTELKLHQETRKQNEILDQIHNGLGDLLQGARAMNAELADQNEGAEQLQSRFEQTQDRLHQVNTKSQLRKFR